MSGWPKKVDNRDMDIAVVIPAFNESKHLSGVLKRLTSCPTQHNLIPIVVDDGSRDTTSRIARAFPGVKVLRHRTNLGKGAAAKTGCDTAYKMQADIVVLMDADGQHQPEDIDRIIQPLLGTNDVHLVIGARRMNEKMPILMRCGNIVLTLLSRILFKIQVRDTQSGFRAFRRQIYPTVRWNASNYAMETEMLILGTMQRLKCVEVVIDTVYHNSYKGTTVLDGLRILKTLVKWRLLWYREYKSLEPFSV